MSVGSKLFELILQQTELSISRSLTPAGPGSGSSGTEVALLTAGLVDREGSMRPCHCVYGNRPVSAHP